MERLAPPLELCISLRLGIESGQSVMRVIKKFQMHGRDEMSCDLAMVLAAFERGETVKLRPETNNLLYRRALLELIEAGLRGEPILNQLKELETEILKACHSDIDKYVAALPMRTMIPLMLIQFPAFLLLLLGPIVSELIRGLSS